MWKFRLEIRASSFTITAFPGNDMKKTNPKVDLYLRHEKKWQKELQALRKILLASPLTEELKWSKPCYTYQDSNLLVLCSLKEACAVGFLKGALLKDAAGLLLRPGEHSQSMRWMKFASLAEVAARKSILKAYVLEAIAAEKEGLKVAFKEEHDLTFPAEFHRKLKSNPALKAAFDALTPGRKRGYSLFFSAAKQAATREARIEKCVPLILKGRGLNDR